MTTASFEKVVKDRYSLGAEARVAELCCPTDYDLTSEVTEPCCGPDGCC